MRLLISAALVIGALAITTDKPFSLNVDTLNEMIDDLKKHKDSIPSFVMDPITNLTEEEKTQIVEFVNNLKKEQVERINSLKQLVQLAEEQAPLVGKKFKAIYDEFVERSSKVTTEGQQFINMVSP
ncbi:hypothetical protein OESDEN_17972 [Oesophagostomum dentatum]|uniref:SXP/RAL-2 family protein Ani s 5-like cation-binding domain-containing protein n=1 Tax=Oesophagostomum dentatum TaxID=61180 RepID=A0A0B1SGJ9_OESDE|nr:hypothetical protein OESDEN_17972 [Oesophagostomum dentatum]